MKFKRLILLLVFFSSVLFVAAQTNVPAAQLESFSVDSTSPAGELYKYIWTSERLNPYRVVVDSMPDSIEIDVCDFVFPTKSNRVTSTFGFRRYRYHYGVDIGLQTGDTVKATFSGKIRIVDYEAKGYGRYVVIRHDNGLETVSAHLSKVLVKENQEVKAGDPIGLGGNTGHSTGPHLHYEMRMMGNAFNPTKLIDFENKCIITGCYEVTHNETYSHVKHQVISTPGLNAKPSSTTATSSSTAYYRVKQNDTLSSIARRYGTTVAKLCKLNHISQNSILSIGQRIRYR
ncbi:MAG: M23 family metallopeptidase [Bacteroidales bacterium]|nr:M23 family metallopeptidase [Bacteroidales bacterium]